MPVLVCVLAMSILGIRPEIVGPLLHLDAVNMFGDRFGADSLETQVCNTLPEFMLYFNLNGIDPEASIHGYENDPHAVTSIEWSYQAFYDYWSHGDTDRLVALVYGDTIYQRINLGEMVGRSVTQSQHFVGDIANELDLDARELEDMSLGYIYIYISFSLSLPGNKFFF